ncbi:MAG: M56 family metallopeptidase [Acidimicrobiales bacterium]
MLLTTFSPLAGVVLVTLGARAVPWRRLPPRAALWALTSIGVISASTVVVAVAVLVGGFVLGTSVGAWLVDACSLFAAHHRVPVPVGIAVVTALGAIAWRVGVVVSTAWAARLDGDGPLTVVDLLEPIAFARSGRHGGVVVSTGMLDALEPAQRRVLFAHERAHVQARHDLHLLASQLAAAVLPWLGWQRDELCLATERAADATALVEVRGDRRLVATAIARAALAADRHGAVAPALAFSGGAVGFRVESMLHPSGRAPVPASASGLLGVVGVLGATVFVHHVATLLAHICW